MLVCTTIPGRTGHKEFEKMEYSHILTQSGGGMGPEFLDIFVKIVLYRHKNFYFRFIFQNITVKFFDVFLFLLKFLMLCHRVILFDRKSTEPTGIEDDVRTFLWTENQTLRF